MFTCHEKVWRSEIIVPHVINSVSVTLQPCYSSASGNSLGNHGYEAWWASVVVWHRCRRRCRYTTYIKMIDQYMSIHNFRQNSYVHKSYEHLQKSNGKTKIQAVQCNLWKLRHQQFCENYKLVKIRLMLISIILNYCYSNARIKCITRHPHSWNIKFPSLQNTAQDFWEQIWQLLI
jgi:hypothetical protein